MSLYMLVSDSPCACLLLFHLAPLAGGPIYCNSIHGRCICCMTLPAFDQPSAAQLAALWQS